MKNMEHAVKCLAITVPESVFADVSNRWEKLKTTLLASNVNTPKLGKEYEIVETWFSTHVSEGEVLSAWNRIFMASTKDDGSQCNHTPVNIYGTKCLKCGRTNLEMCDD